MKIASGKRVRRGTAFVFTSFTAVLLVVSMAWACTLPEGATFFADGTSTKSVARGTRISALANNAHQGVNYLLVIGSNGPHPTHACMQTDYVVNPTQVVPNANGFIGKVSGPAGNASLPLGTYQVCFRDINGNVATAAATLTIT
jgi:hypothetical protein